MFASTLWGAVGEFAATRHGAFTRKQAAALGITSKVIARWLRDGLVVEHYPSVLLVVGSPDTWHRRLMAATLASNRAGIAAGLSAAALHGADGHRPGPLELLVPTSRKGYDPNVIQRIGPFHEDDIVHVDEIPCTGVARTICDIAGFGTDADTRLVLEWAWRCGHSLTWITRTAARLDHPGRKGPRRVLRLIEDLHAVGRPTESPLEARLAAILAGVPGLARQFVVRDPAGRFVARVDFAVPDVRLAIEAHSRRYHFGPGATSRDEMREHAMQTVGWDTVYVGSKRLDDPPAVLGDIRAIVARRRLDLGLAPRPEAC